MTNPEFHCAGDLVVQKGDDGDRMSPPRYGPYTDPYLIASPLKGDDGDRMFFLESGTCLVSNFDPGPNPNPNPNPAIPLKRPNPNPDPGLWDMDEDTARRLSITDPDDIMFGDAARRRSSQYSQP